MAEGPYLMGIDGGTGGVRAGIFDRKGEAVVFHGVEHGTRFPRPGWAEQDPADWWSCLVSAVRGAMEKSGISPEEVAGIATDATTCTVVAMDRQNRAMRPALLWMDVRASDQARRVQETGDPALKYNGYGPSSAEWMPSKTLWLKENERETYDGAARICDYVDWMTFRLTGEWTASINTASFRAYYDRGAGGWPESLYESLGIGDVLEKFPPQVLDMGVAVGGLTSEAAQELGLPEGLPVAQGGGDAFVGTLGLGVTQPGKMALITGSSHVIVGQSANPHYGQGFFGSYTDGIVPGQYSVEGGQVSTGSIVAWFKNRFASDAAAEAQRRGVDAYDVLNEMAADVPIGSEGLVVLDYFQGNRTPYTDPLARGMIWGLSLGHTPGHVFRAILEGICYGTEHIYRTMREHGFQPGEAVVAGGPTKSEMWMQMHADVSNVPVSLTRESEGPVLGSAMLAAVGAGIYPNIQAAADEMVHTKRVIEPNAEAHEQYKFYVDRYVETYPQMRGLMHKMSAHEASKPEAVAGT